MVLCKGAPEGSNGSVSGLKRLRRWDHSLVSSDRLVGGIEDGTPGYKATCFLLVEMKL